MRTLWVSGRRSPPGPTRWALGWGLVTENDDDDEYGEDDLAWDRFCVWIGRAGKSTIWLWRGRRRPFTG